MRLEELGGGWLQLAPALRNLRVSGVTCDSRSVSSGSVFVAVQGGSFDGHLFALDAERAGAAVVVGERARRASKRAASRASNTAGRSGPGAGVPHGAPNDAALAALSVPYLRVADAREALGRFAAAWHGHAHEGLRIAGVTGTKGKTTTAWLLDAILRSSGAVCGLFGTVGHRIGDRFVGSTHTTPSSLELHRSFEELVAAGGSHAVLEVSSHGIDQRRTAGFAFDVAVFTNLAPEHLDYHGTLENYLLTKTRLFQELRRDAFAVLPREETVSARLRSETPAQVRWYGLERCDGVEHLRMGPDGSHFLWKGLPVETRLWGTHNLLDLVGAMTAAECLGIDPETVAAGAAAAMAPPGRLEEVVNDRGLRVFVDYAHTDGSLDAVLQALRPLTPGRIITVFGCGGDRDREKRPRMGRVAEQRSDHIVVTSDNPRGEEPESIMDDILRGLERPDDAVFEPDRRAAIALGIRMARRQDTVLIAGKGHETYQEIKSDRIYFDDREVAREFLAEGRGGN